eukprot:1517963-Prymnesium_polylepis.1
MCSAMRKAAVPTKRKHEPLPRLKPSTSAVTAVGVAVLGDLQVRFGVAGDTPPVSEQGTSSESDGEE